MLFQQILQSRALVSKYFACLSLDDKRQLIPLQGTDMNIYEYCTEMLARARLSISIMITDDDERE